MSIDNGSGGWGGYQRLVLAELERHSTLFEELLRNQSLNATEQALFKQSLDSLMKNQALLQQQISLQGEQIAALQEGEVVQAAIHKYRNWIIAIIFALITTGLIPLVRLLFGIGG